MKTVVLFGGFSREREVSLVTGTAVFKSLMSLGHEVILIDPAEGRKLYQDENLPEIHEQPPTERELNAFPTTLDRQAFWAVMNELLSEKPDFVFNALHGGAGEDGHLQALLDMFRIPYNGSGALASAIAMNKALSKKMFEGAGIRTPAWRLFPAMTPFAEAESALKSSLRYPLVIKPNEEGSTVGLSIVREPSELETAWTKALPFGAILAEHFIEGREITVAVLGKKALPVIEIVPEGGVYDYEHKYQKGKTEYVCPAGLLKSAQEKAQLFAMKAFDALGCSGYARVDFRLGLDNQFYCLEVNTLPGMTETSLVPKAAQADGIGFNDLINNIIRYSEL